MPETPFISNLLELYLVHLPHDILTGESQIDASGIDVPMSQLLLKRIEAPSAVQEVDGITVAEQVSMYRPLQVCAPSRPLGDRDKLLTSS